MQSSNIYHIPNTATSHTINDSIRIEECVFSDNIQDTLEGENALLCMDLSI